MKTSVMDSDFNRDELDKLIAERPELAVLREFGEISVEVDGNSKDEDNTFDVGDGTTAGGVDLVVDDEGLTVTWFPDESDLQYLKEQEDVNAEDLKRFEAAIHSEPRKNISVDLVNVLTSDALEEIKKKLLETLA